MAVDTLAKRQSSFRVLGRRTLQPDGAISTPDRRASLGFYAYPSSEPDAAVLVLTTTSARGDTTITTGGGKA